MATTKGCEIVCRCPIGRAPSSYAYARRLSGTNSRADSRHRREHALVGDAAPAELPPPQCVRASTAPTGELTSRAFEALRNEPPGVLACRAARSGSATARTYRKRHERNQTDEHAERAHVRTHTEASCATAKRPDDDRRRGQRAENTADRTGDRLGRLADQEADRATERSADYGRRPDAEDVRAENPRDRDGEAQPEPQTQPDRVPAAHVGQSREAGARRLAPAISPARRRRDLLGTERTTRGSTRRIARAR